MSWKEQLDKAVATVREAATSDKAKDIAAKAKAAATSLVDRVRKGAVGAADTFIEANRDPSSIELNFLNARTAILSPADDIAITRPEPASLVIADGQGNGLVINAAADPAFVVEIIGSVTQLSANTYDLGPEDGINVVVTKF